MPDQPQVDPNDLTDRFNTQLSPADETKFLQWQKSLGKQGSTYDYDLRGAWKSGAQQAANGHFTDQFKKPNHPTFSDQSQYSSAQTPGGKWQQEKDGTWSYMPSAYQMQRSSPEDLQHYFDTVEKGNKLVLPQQQQQPPKTMLDAVNGALSEIGPKK